MGEDGRVSKLEKRQEIMIASPAFFVALIPL